MGFLEEMRSPSWFASVVWCYDSAFDILLAFSACYISILLPLVM